MKEPIQETQIFQQEKIPPSRFLLSHLRWWRAFWSSFLALSALVGLISALMTFLPRVNIDFNQVAEVSNDFNIIATLQNTGFMPLENVKILMGLCEIGTKPGGMSDRMPVSSCSGSLQSRIDIGGLWHVKELAMDQKFTISLGNLLNIASGELYNVDISIIVVYRPAFWPFLKEKEFGFKSRLRTDGKLDWHAVPR